ncbi:hypothetical protein BMF94_5928 [Rhodotorula taiwanensis]|uniref:Transcription elongation factor 1 homolog n=1 Tax=Rhodotorula taiwanensis TaxID=741276 RepID=A0A2S5B2J1_9BASI|nr:hypothetical protein BMF94_5928 [Rhodotorula taiwanensis]
MGKRKSSKKPQTRVKQVLDKSFRCMFCARQGSVTCKMDTKNRVGRLQCKDCNQSFQLMHPSLFLQTDINREEANPIGAPAAGGNGDKRPDAAPKSKKRRVRNESDESGEDQDAEGEEDGEFDPKRPVDEPEAGEASSEGELEDLRSKKKKRRTAVDDDEEEEEAVASDAGGNSDED